MYHRNAPLTETGRLRLARCVVEDGWVLRRAAERFQVSVTCAKRWADRYRAHGEVGMLDRSSRPRRSPGRTPTRTERRIIKVRVLRRWGPARIAGLLGRETPPHPHAGQDPRPQRRQSCRLQLLLHNAVDDHSRLAYSEILPDERKETAVAFWRRAQTFFHTHGITVERVLTDNGPCYISRAWKDALAQAGITHKRTRPYRPQTNGKVERYNRTLLDEWAYDRPYDSETQRRAALPAWLHYYNHHRAHTALAGQPPANRVPNLSGQYT
ncbi:integrase core domain-containing protein [Saccharopolyspora tripterygii]